MIEQPWVPIFYEAGGPTQWFGLAISDWVAIFAGLTGAIIGAVVGGIITAVLQQQARQEAKNTAEEQRKMESKAQAIKLMMRASIVLNDVQATVDALHKQLVRANAHGMTNQPLWSRVAGIVGSRNFQPIDVDELLPFIEASKYELVGKFVEVSMQHEILNDSIELYNERRAALKDMLGASESAGTLLFTPSTPELESKLRPHAVEMESLIQAIKPRAESLLQSAISLNAAIGPAGKEIFGPTFPHIDVSDIPV